MKPLKEYIKKIKKPYFEDSGGNKFYSAESALLALAKEQGRMLDEKISEGVPIPAKLFINLEYLKQEMGTRFVVSGQEFVSLKKVVQKAVGDEGDWIDIEIRDDYTEIDGLYMEFSDVMELIEDIFIYINEEEQ